MKDPAGPPTWLIIAVALLWAFAFGVWRERNRAGGTHDLRARLDQVRGEVRRARKELEERRRAAMPHLVISTPQITDDVVVEIDRSLRRLAMRNGGRVS